MPSFRLKSPHSGKRPVGSLLGPELYLIYISYIPITPGPELVIYADDESFVCAIQLQAVDGLASWISVGG